MKRISKLTIIIMALFGLTSCFGTQKEKASAQSLKGKKTLVAYYSWGGNTKAVGDYIAARLNADIYQIEPVEAYPTDYDECVRKVGEQGKAHEPTLKPTDINLADYELIIIGSPCWWGTIATPVRTFLASNDFGGKTVLPFMTNGSSGKRLQDVKRLCTGATVLDGLSIYNKYQVETTVNTPDNMGDWKTMVNQWIAQSGL